MPFWVNSPSYLVSPCPHPSPSLTQPHREFMASWVVELGGVCSLPGYSDCCWWLPTSQPAGEWSGVPFPPGVWWALFPSTYYHILCPNYPSPPFPLPSTKTGIACFACLPLPHHTLPHPNPWSLFLCGWFWNCLSGGWCSYSGELHMPPSPACLPVVGVHSPWVVFFFWVEEGRKEGRDY